MRNSEAIFDRLMLLAQEKLPDLASQVHEEISRGKLLLANPDMTRHMRAWQRVRDDPGTGPGEPWQSQSALPRPTVKDSATVAYTGDEKLLLLCRALQTLAVSALQSRKTLLTLLETHRLPPVVTFVGLDEDRQIHAELIDEYEDAQESFDAVNDSLQSVIETIGELP